MDQLYIVVFLQILLLANYSYSADGPSPPEGVVYSLGSHQSCILPCEVALNNSYNSPRVSWYHRVTAEEEEGGNATYIALNNTEYWEKLNQDRYYCQYYSPHHFSSRVSEFGCTAGVNTGGGDVVVYSCEQLLDFCYRGVYECRVSAIENSGDEVIVESKEVQVALHPSIVIEPPLPICFHPTASNLTASPVEVASDTFRLNLTWSMTERPDSVACKLIYCAGSRRFQVKMLVYNSIPHSNETLPDYVTDWRHTVKRRGVFYLFDDFDFSADKYYQFHVKNTRNHVTTTSGTYLYIQHYSTKPYIEPIQIATSHLHYFGLQAKAEFTEPLEDQTYQKRYGDTAIIRCTGKGYPTPTLTLEYEHDGKLVTYQRAEGSVEAYLIVQQSYKFFCTASNYIVNLAGEVEQISESVSISIDMVEDKIIKND